MYIANDKTLFQLKQEFNRKFPLLTLEFYARPHGKDEVSFKADELDDELTVSEARRNTSGLTGEISLRGNRKVSRLEEELLKKYGLSVQVFFRSGTCRYQTTLSDNSTLSQLQQRGKQTSQ